MQLTAEQLPITHYKGKYLVVMAFAGCGKTSTLVAFCKENPGARILYLAYNRAIRDEGASKFPSNVVCKTSHQMAWPAFGTKLEHKLGNLRLTDIGNFLETRQWKMIRHVQATLNAFLSSADEQPSDIHALIAVTNDGEEESTAASHPHYLAELAEHARRLWEEMIDPDSRVLAPHDAYLKLYQLSQPQLNYDVILFDEAQDSNPVTAAIVACQQSAQKIFVGDRWQQIYRWRGAENALAQQVAAGADQMHLTKSFRFGPMIAGVANIILNALGESKPLIGAGPMDKALTKMPYGVNKYTILNRTVSGVIMSAIDEVNRGKIIYWNGGIEGYQISDLEDLYHFSKNDTGKVLNKRLVGQFKHFSNYVQAAEETKDPEMSRMVRILKTQANVPQLLASLRRNTTEDEAEADVTLSTVHRSKGLEWPVVLLAEDFPELSDSERFDTPEKLEDELNLLYVASTRAMSTLIINSVVEGLVLDYTSRARKQATGA